MKAVSDAPSAIWHRTALRFQEITKHGRGRRAEFGSTEQAGSVKVKMCLFFPPFFCFFGSLLCCLTGCLIAEQVEEAAQRPRSSDVVVVSVDKSSRTENALSSQFALLQL